MNRIVGLSLITMIALWSASGTLAQTSLGLYWQCKAADASTGTPAGYCPVSPSYPLPTQQTPAASVVAVSGTNTATVAATTYTRQLIFAHTIWTTSATVGNREVVLQLLNSSGTVVGDWHAGAFLTASLTGQHIEFMPGVYRETSLINGTLQVPFASGLLVPPEYTVKILDSNAVSGSDAFTGYLEFITQVN